MVTPVVDFAPETGSDHDDSDSDSQDLDVPFPQHYRMPATASITRSKSPDSLAESDHGSIQSGFSSIFSGFSRTARANTGSRIAKKHPWEIKGVEPVHYGTHETTRSRKAVPFKSDRTQSVPVNPGSTQQAQQWERHDGSTRSEQRSLDLPLERTQRRVSNPNPPYRPMYPTFAFTTENFATRMRRVAGSVDTTPIQPYPPKPTAAQAPRNSMFDTFADYMLGPIGIAPNPSHEEHQFFRTGTNHYDPTTGYILQEAKATPPPMTLASLFRLQEEEVTDNLHDFAIKEGISSARKTQKVSNNTTFEFDAPQGRMATNPAIPFMENDKNNTWMAAKVGQGLDAKSDSEASESDCTTDVNGLTLDEISIGEEYHIGFQYPMDSFLMGESQDLDMAKSNAEFHESYLNREGLEQLQDIEHAETVLKTFQGILEQAEHEEQERLRILDLKIEMGSLPSLMSAELSLDSSSDHDDDFSLDGKAFFEFLEALLDDYEDEFKNPKTKSVFELFKWSERINVDVIESNDGELEHELNENSVNKGVECVESEFMSDPLATLDPLNSMYSSFGLLDVFESSPHQSPDEHKAFGTNKKGVEIERLQESNKSVSLEAGWSDVEEKKEEKNCIDKKVSKLAIATDSFEVSDIVGPTSKVKQKQMLVIPEMDPMPFACNSNGNIYPILVHVIEPISKQNCQGVPIETETTNAARSGINVHDEQMPRNEVRFNADTTLDIDINLKQTDLTRRDGNRETLTHEQEKESNEVSDAETAKNWIWRNETKIKNIAVLPILRKDEVLNKVMVTSANITKDTTVNECFELTQQNVTTRKPNDSLTKAFQKKVIDPQNPKQTTKRNGATRKSEDVEPPTISDSQMEDLFTKKTSKKINDKRFSNDNVVENDIYLTRRVKICEEVKSRKIKASVHIVQVQTLSTFTLPIKRKTSKKGHEVKLSNDDSVKNDDLEDGRTKICRGVNSKSQRISIHNTVHAPATSSTTGHFRSKGACHDDGQQQALLVGMLPITRKNSKKGDGKKRSKGFIEENEFALKRRSKLHDMAIQPSCDDACRNVVVQMPAPLLPVLPTVRTISKNIYEKNDSYNNIGENEIGLKRRNIVHKEKYATREESTRYAAVQDPSPLTRILSNVKCANNISERGEHINDDRVEGEINISPASLENELLAFLYASKLAGKSERRKKKKLSTELKEVIGGSSSASGNLNDFLSPYEVLSKAEGKAGLYMSQDKGVRPGKYQSRSDSLREESADFDSQDKTIRSNREKGIAQDLEKWKPLTNEQSLDPRIIQEAGSIRKEAKMKKKRSEIEGGLLIDNGCDGSLHSRQSARSKERKKKMVPNDKDGCYQVKKRNQIVNIGKKIELSQKKGVHTIDEVVETDMLRQESSESKPYSCKVTPPKDAEGHLKKRRLRASSVPRTMEKALFESRFGHATSVDGNCPSYVSRETSTTSIKYEKRSVAKRRSTQSIASGSKSSGSRGSSHRTPPMKQYSEDSIDISPPVFRKAPSRDKPHRKSDKKRTKDTSQGVNNKMNVSHITQDFVAE